jgi:tRNA-dihydrouridine synthase
MDSFLDSLRNGAVLAELGGYGDGPYCAKHGAGCALVVLGTYIVDARDDVPYPAHFVFKPGRESYEGYLREHVAAARGSGAAVGVSVVAVDLDDEIDFLLAAEEAGADYVSLCLHSTMSMFLSEGLSSALLRREHLPRLRERVGAHLDALQRPFIPKLRATASPDSDAAIAALLDLGIEIIHANVGDAATARGADVIRRLKGCVPFLIAGGGIATVEDARSAIDAGADAVAIGTAAMHDADLCGRITGALRHTPGQ